GCATPRRSVFPDESLSCGIGYCRPDSSKPLVAAVGKSAAATLVVGTSTRATAACAGEPDESCRWISEATVSAPDASTGGAQTDIREIPTAAIAQLAATTGTRSSPTACHFRARRSIRDGL